MNRKFLVIILALQVLAMPVFSGGQAGAVALFSFGLALFNGPAKIQDLRKYNADAYAHRAPGGNGAGGGAGGGSNAYGKSGADEAGDDPGDAGDDRNGSGGGSGGAGRESDDKAEEKAFRMESNLLVRINDLRRGIPLRFLKANINLRNIAPAVSEEDISGLRALFQLALSELDNFRILLLNGQDPIEDIEARVDFWDNRLVQEETEILRRYKAYQNEDGPSPAKRARRSS